MSEVAKRINTRVVIQLTKTRQGISIIKGIITVDIKNTRAIKEVLGLLLLEMLQKVRIRYSLYRVFEPRIFIARIIIGNIESEVEYKSKKGKSNNKQNDLT